MSHSDSEDSFKSLPEEDEWAIPKSFPRGSSNVKQAEQPANSETSPSAEQQNATVSSKPVSIPRFSPSEETALLTSSNVLKARGNTLFGSASYDNAIQSYDRALAECPNYLDFELAVLRSNIAACYLKLEEWKQVIESAEKGLDCLERLEPLPVPKVKSKDERISQLVDSEKTDTIQEIDDAAADRIANLEASGHTLDEVRKLQVKLLMRRAKARTEIGGWSPLQGADEDYRVLLLPAMQPFLSPTDLRNVKESAARLAPRLNAAKDKEMAEMMDKLKGLGNSILKPFGLSTENFQFVKDEKSGGYSMNFEQNPGKK